MRSAAPAAGAAAAMLLVGTSTAVSATAADHPVHLGQALRYGLAAVVLLVVVRRLRLPRVRLTRRDVLQLVALAATGLVGFNLFLVEATRHASPALIGTVVGAAPVVLAVAGPLVERRAIGTRTVVAAAVVALGTAIAAGLGTGSPRGVLLAAGALLGEVLFSLLAVPLLPKLGPVRIAAWSAALSVPMLLTTGLLFEPLPAHLPTATQLAAFGYLGAVVTAVAFLLWYRALRDLGTARAGLFAGLVPLGSLLATVALGVGTPRPADIAGAVLVMIGVTVGMSRVSPGRMSPRIRPAAPTTV
ncbi:DMT family transporter [Streptomyces sp. NPDC013953]|uniref:DMT family transporter n=1 Tax=Streptomyces sp. NPDC013953 TaxID=3364868 RepID=UPI0036FFA5BD